MYVVHMPLNRRLLQGAQASRIRYETRDRYRLYCISRVKSPKGYRVLKEILILEEVHTYVHTEYLLLQSTEYNRINTYTINRTSRVLHIYIIHSYICTLVDSFILRNNGSDVTNYVRSN